MITKSNKNTGAIYKCDKSYGFVFKGEVLVWRKKLPSIPSIENPQPGDIVIWDNSNKERIITNQEILEDCDISRFEPIGVIVVPISSSNKSLKMLSLKDMSCLTPDIGKQDDDEENPYSGAGNYDTTLTGYRNMGPYIENDENCTIKGARNTVFLPSDLHKDNNLCLHDTNAGYAVSQYMAPSPYLSNGSENRKYTETSSPSTPYNYFLSSNGKYMTERKLNCATAQKNWKTDETITNLSSTGYAPLMCCSWRYHTKGTNQGDWYVPSCGELGYMIARFSIINNSLSFIKEKWENASLLKEDIYYITITDNSAGYVCDISSSGRIMTTGYNYKDDRCRAFCTL